MKKIKVFECYAGYGGASFALEKANIPYECVGYSEIKKSAIKIIDINFPGRKNYGDITKMNIEGLPDFDLITGGFPCQDVSIAGLRDLSQGRTNTVFQMLDIIRIKKPKYCLLENVQGILSMLNGELIKEIVRQLKIMGYAVSYDLLYSKDYGTPQNRPRVWIAAELGRDSFLFNPFPKKEELKIFVKDLLEYDIEHKYLTDKQVNQIIKKSEERGKPLGTRINPDVSRTLCGCSPGGYPADTIYLTNQHPLLIPGLQEHQTPRIDGVCSTLLGNMKRGKEYIPIIEEPKCLDLYNHKVCDDGISPTLTEPHHNTLRLIENRKLRCLTPRECFRLQGFFNDEIEFGDLPKTSLYDLAGNGWDVNLVSKIFKKWLK